MNRMNRATIAVLLLAFGLFFSSENSQAYRNRSDGYHMMGQGMMSQLTEQEQKTVMELMQKYHGPMMELRKQLFSKRAELNAVMAQEKFDAKKARALGEEISALQTKLNDQHMEMFIQMREKGVSYYGTCMSGGTTGPFRMDGSMGPRKDGRRMMMDSDTMGQGKQMDGLDNKMMNRDSMQ